MKSLLLNLGLKSLSGTWAKCMHISPVYRPMSLGSSNMCFQAFIVEGCSFFGLPRIVSGILKKQPTEHNVHANALRKNGECRLMLSAKNPPIAGPIVKPSNAHKVTGELVRARFCGVEISAKYNPTSHKQFIFSSIVVLKNKAEFFLVFYALAF